MQSQVNALLHVSRGLCKDVQATYPAIRGLDLDYERLSLYCRSRGLGVFTLDLPALDALLLTGLETGRLCPSGALSREVSKEIKVPRLFSGLWLRIFDKDANLKQEVDVTALFFLRQFLRLGKNIEVECSFDRKKAVLENFYGVERALRAPTGRWDDDELDLRNIVGSVSLTDCVDNPRENVGDFFQDHKGPVQEEAAKALGLRRLLDQVQRVSDLVLSNFDIYDPLSFSGWLEMNGKGTGFKHGPGAVAEQLKQYDKSAALSKNWTAKLEAIFPYEDCGRTAGSPLERPLNHEVASRMYCVPKTAKGPRLIAAEPVSHMWCQQCTWTYLEEQIRSCYLTGFVDFRKQSMSGDLVLQASLDRKLATVDLSDASDRLSCWTVERIFRSRPDILSALHAARTRYLRIDILGDVDFLRLKKFASQGTATTFPIQSIVFLCIALGACLDGDISEHAVRKLRGQVRVYGDDIIIPRHGYERLVAIMDALQLKVNIAKSYVRGHFRESCGVDGYYGYDVTPVSPKTLVADSPASSQAVVDTTNNLFNKGLWNASYSLETLLPARLRRGIRIVGHLDAGFSGLSSFSGSDESHLAKRWNPRLHRYEVRVWALSARTHKREREGFSALLDFVSRKHNHEHARIVSEYGDTRKSKAGLLWEPLNSGAHLRHMVTRGR